MDAISAFFSSLEPTLIPLGAIVTFVVISLVRGWIVPRGIHEARITDKESQIQNLIQERDDWKDAFLVSEKTNQELTKQNGKLVESGEATNRLIESLRNNIERSNPPAPQGQIGS